MAIRHLAVADMALGCIAILFQLAMLITLHDWVDWICIGFWGGGFMVLTGMLTLQKRPKKMITMAVFTIISGLCMLGFYSWHVSVVDCSYNNQIMNKSSSWEKEPDLCDWRLASDIIFIILGCCTIVLNIFLAGKASSVMGGERSSSSHSAHPTAAAAPHQPQPAAVPTHVTYVTAYQTAPAPYPQTHTYPPSGPPPPAGYPSYQGPPVSAPPYNPDYPPQYTKN